jgi:hypothetical protein
MTKFLGIWELDILLGIGNWILEIGYCHPTGDLPKGEILEIKLLFRISYFKFWVLKTYERLFTFRKKITYYF